MYYTVYYIWFCLYQIPGIEDVEPEYKASIICAVLEPGAAHMSNT